MKDPNNVYEVYVNHTEDKAELMIRMDPEWHDFVTLSMSEIGVMRLIGFLMDSLDKMRLDENHNTDLNEMYHLFEQRYSTFPTQMSREDAFGRALLEGMIGWKEIEKAKKYFGELWNYVGD